MRSEWALRLGPRRPEAGGEHRLKKEEGGDEKRKEEEGKEEVGRGRRVRKEVPRSLEEIFKGMIFKFH